MLRPTLAVVAVLAVLLTPSAGRAVERATSNELSVADRAYVASQIHTLASIYFAHWEAVPRFDLDAAFRDYLTEAVGATDRRAFDLATLAFVARLRNGHSYFHDDGLVSPWNLPIGFRARPLGGKWVVNSSRLATIRPGDVVSAVDGEPVERFFERNRVYLSASSDRQARMKLFFSRVLFPATFPVTLADGRRVIVDPGTQKLEPAEEGKVDGRWVEPGRIAYVRVPGWDVPDYEEEALRLAREFRDARALIIDVRGNGGGDTPLRFIRRLQDRPWRSWSSSTPMTIAISRAYGEVLKTARLPDVVAAEVRGLASFAAPQVYWPSELNPPEPDAYAGKLVILVDADCASACEDFVVPFKDNHRATIVGETTAGSSGMPFVKRFPVGMTVAVGARRERMPDGSPFEGVGITPEIPIERTALDLRSDRDPVLEAAIRLARPSK
jgi:carboxyl-terminal processing protease